MSSSDKQNENSQNIQNKTLSNKIQYILLQKNQEISNLREKLSNLQANIISLQNEVYDLRNVYTSNVTLGNELKSYKDSNVEYGKEVDRLNKVIVSEHKKFTDEKNQMQLEHQAEMNQIKLANDNYSQKLSLVNQLQYDKMELEQTVEKLKEDNQNIIEQHKIEKQQNELKNEIKFTNLKKKMIENINQTQSKVTELNIEYMAVSTKLTLLQNHQLLMQIEYQGQQLEEANRKKDMLEKRIIALNKDIQVHKEVEISLADKNRRLKEENKKIREMLNKTQKSPKPLSLHIVSPHQTIQSPLNSQIISPSITQNILNSTSTNSSNIILKNEKNNNKFSKNISLKKIKNKSISESEEKTDKINNINESEDINQIDLTKTLMLERKIKELEKNLTKTREQYKEYKEKNEYIESILREYEVKYSGLFKFLENAIENFCNDEELKSLPSLYVSLPHLQKCDFSSLSKKEKYSTLLIIMKYLMPIIFLGKNAQIKKDNSKYNIYLNKDSKCNKKDKEDDNNKYNQDRNKYDNFDIFDKNVKLKYRGKSVEGNNNSSLYKEKLNKCNKNINGKNIINLYEKDESKDNKDIKSNYTNEMKSISVYNSSNVSNYISIYSDNKNKKNINENSNISDNTLPKIGKK